MSGFFCNCGKEGWHSRAEARDSFVALRVQKPEVGNRRDRLEMYRCREARGEVWHIGHSRKPVSFRKNKRSQRMW